MKAKLRYINYKSLDQIVWMRDGKPIEFSKQERLHAILKRNHRKSEYYEQKYHGKEDKHTFHGGWNLGYWEGRVTSFEECLDLLEDRERLEKFLNE